MKRVWLNAELLKGKLAFSATDRGLTLGDGVFETIAVTNTVALWRFEHLERMRKSAAALGIPYPEEKVENAIDALTHKTKGHHVLRLTLTRGDGGRGLAGAIEKPTLVGTLMPFDHTQRFKPASLITSSVRRNLNSPASALKTLSYIDNILAAREAQDKGADDALMLNSAGRVACTTIANLFLETEGGLVTPALGEAVLPGIMRAEIIRTARAFGIPVKEKRIAAKDLQSADHIFITNSLRFLRGVNRLDGKRFSIRSKLIDRIVQSLLQAEQEQLILD
jgi:branched-chain amino acid aminotransferase